MPVRIIHHLQRLETIALGPKGSFGNALHGHARELMYTVDEAPNVSLYGLLWQVVAIGGAEARVADQSGCTANLSRKEYE